MGDTVNATTRFMPPSSSSSRAVPCKDLISAYNRPINGTQARGWSHFFLIKANSQRNWLPSRQWISDKKLRLLAHIADNRWQGSGRAGGAYQLERIPAIH